MAKSNKNRQTPSVRLRRLAVELRKLRAEAGLSRERVCEQAGLDYVTLYRIERAQARPQRRTLGKLLRVYSAADEHAEYLRDLAERATTAGWLQPYHSELDEVYLAYISFESEAASVRHYGAQFVPGLLQTEEHARASIRGIASALTDEQVEDRVRTRLTRQSFLDRAEGPLRLLAMIDEAALHRVVGGPDVHRAQLRHLISVAGRPNVTVQVVPFRAGAHPGLPGQFSLMDFPDPRDEDLVYLDGIAGNQILETQADITGYGTMFDGIRAEALSQRDSLALIEVLAD